MFGYTLYSPLPGRTSTFEAMVWESYNTSSLIDIPPISREEFLTRQAALAIQLKEEGIDAFIAEPSGTTQYFANVSEAVWELSERPFLFVVTPEEFFFLVPLFEVSRARMLNIATNDTKFVTWAEGMSAEECIDGRYLAV